MDKPDFTLVQSRDIWLTLEEEIKVAEREQEDNHKEREAAFESKHGGELVGDIEILGDWIFFWDERLTWLHQLKEQGEK
ncbi:MAG: hypothetical protein GY757_19200 [bacterium]|nr:hypothetical protein [bacterium]